MAAESPEMLRHNREMLDAVTGIALALHQISHDIHKLAGFVDKHAPVLDAYQRGGILAARTARKAAANGR